MMTKIAAAVLLACFVVAPFVVGSSCSGPQALEFRIRLHPDAATYEELGRWFGDRHQYGCAIEAYRSGLALEPDSSELSYLLGVTLYAAGDANAAVAPLRQSLQSKTTAKEAHLLLAAAFVDLQNKESAKREYEATLQLDPRSTTALEGLSNLLLADRHYSAVINLLRYAPQDETLILNLAQAYDNARMLDHAAEILKSALRANPSSVRLMNALATVYLKQALYPEALRLAEESVRLHPSNMEGQDLYLHTLVVSHESDKARALAKKLLAARPHDFEVLYLSGVLEHQDGDNSAARQDLEEAVKLSPKDFNARYNFGMVLADLNDAAGAKEQLEKALSFGAGPNEPQVRYRLSMVLRTLGKDREAEEQSDLTQKELQAVEDNTLAFQKSEEAEAALKGGDSLRAVSLYREAVEATPNDAFLNFQLAVALDRAGDNEGEEAALKRVIGIDSTFALAHGQLGYLASKKGDFASAEQHFREAVRDAPLYAGGWVGLAAALGNESRMGEAIDAVSKAIQLDRHNKDALHLRQELMHAQSQH